MRPTDYEMSTALVMAAAGCELQLQPSTFLTMPAHRADPFVLIAYASLARDDDALGLSRSSGAALHPWLQLLATRRAPFRWHGCVLLL